MRKVFNTFVIYIVICILTLNLSALASAEPNTVNEEEFKPLALTLLNPSIHLAISQYYQKIQKPQPSYGLYDMKVPELKGNRLAVMPFEWLLKSALTMVHTILHMQRNVLHLMSIPAK